MNALASTAWLDLGRDRSLSGLMNLYESNFQRLLQLIPGLFLPVDQARSFGSGETPLYLEVLERSPYTLTLLLTHRLAGGGEVPRLRVRLYRDAGLAQAMDAGAAPQGENIERQWRHNLLLNKWLDWCLSNDHGFVLAGERLPRERA